MEKGLGEIRGSSPFIFGGDRYELFRRVKARQALELLAQAE